MFLPSPPNKLVSLYLEMCEKPFDPKESEKDVEKFVSSYLKMDGIFVLRMISMHNGVIFAAELLWRLWARFYGYETVYQEQNEEKTCAPAWVPEGVVNEIRRRHKGTCDTQSEPGDVIVENNTCIQPGDAIKDNNTYIQPGDAIKENIIQPGDAITEHIIPPPRPTAPKPSIDLDDSQKWRNIAKTPNSFANSKIQDKAESFDLDDYIDSTKENEKKPLKPKTSNGDVNT